MELSRCDFSQVSRFELSLVIIRNLLYNYQFTKCESKNFILLFIEIDLLKIIIHMC